MLEVIAPTRTPTSRQPPACGRGRSTTTKQSSFFRLPPELRLKIYEYALAVPNEYTDRPLIVVNDRGNTFTSRGQYRALSMCPSWVGQDGTARSLLSVNRQIHDEAEDFLYSRNTLFFLNSFDLNRLGAFLDTLSATARSRIRSVGFEICFFVHSQTGVPKRTFKEYERAARLLAEKLPRWSSVFFYLAPRFYYPSACVGGRELSARGVLYLATVFGALRKDMHFFPLPSMHRHIMDEAQRLVGKGSRSSLGRSSL
ncbi:uncharacterized protein ACLA_012310 [Aspergillus clavatus NRRL 1]|uniref:DUF7730 domain-containing protein n=1 Tax=Aspergillus clavatus (strain ATCC 1007 / CBS 513.65 / DSM 816 / NCTC 3887 / NRRL 1 / QM 1276 / 107) TaxID=344612 RepID=A1CAN5_ASPCL|nr:uncharacterized protein ACLA_012310 [Aspergillus clavatus NRRL 1]EAW12803.1 conserved hypothetical protein [Aspergillus clavatus NRRL 1]